MRRRFVLLSNRLAGLASTRLVDACVEALRGQDAEVTRHEPASIEEARAIARRAADEGRCNAVIGAGGDGTIRQLAAALIGTKTPLAVIPVGTGNVLAHEIGMERSVSGILDMLLNGRVVGVSTARANGEPFLLMASAGLDARIVSNLNQDLKSRVGRMAYAAPILGALAKPLDRLRVEVGGMRLTATWVIVTNAAHYAGPFVLTSRRDITKRGLEAVLFKARTRADLLGQILSLASGSLSERCTELDDVEMISCSEVTITAERPVPTQLDGDVFGVTPLVVATAADRLQLVVPAGSSLR